REGRGGFIGQDDALAPDVGAARGIVLAFGAEAADAPLSARLCLTGARPRQQRPEHFQEPTFSLQERPANQNPAPLPSITVRLCSPVHFHFGGGVPAVGLKTRADLEGS